MDAIAPLPYHCELRDYLKSQEPDLWKWFASAQAQADYTENLRLALLKSTYRLDPETHPDLYQSVNLAKARLDLDVPVTIYQAQNNPQLNAEIYFIPDEGHIVFSGPVLTLLNNDELTSILGHELAHFLLWRQDDGEFHITARLIEAVAQDLRGSLAHAQSARRCRLYTEIFADRGSLRVTQQLHPVVSGLVKIETGLHQVSAPGYLNQAREIFARTSVTVEGISHPETFIRARALELWDEQKQASNQQVASLIEGASTLDDLDLIGQLRLQDNTQQLLKNFLQPTWFRTPAVLGHARLFFEDFQPASHKDPGFLNELGSSHPTIREYFCYLLLDFVTADPDLDNAPLAAAFEFSKQLGIETEFEKIVVKELKPKTRELRKLKEDAPSILAKLG